MNSYGHKPDYPFQPKELKPRFATDSLGEFMKYSNQSKPKGSEGYGDPKGNYHYKEEQKRPEYANINYGSTGTNNYNYPSNGRLRSDATNYSETTNSSYPRDSRLSSSGRRVSNGFNTLGKNIVSNGGFSEPVTREGEHNSTIKKPTQVRPLNNAYQDTGYVYKMNSNTSKASTGITEESEKDRRYGIDRWRQPDRTKDWNNPTRETPNSNFRNKMNDTFTSQKAKRNVSDYYNINNRPVHSREREDTKVDSTKSPDFSTIGLENIGNT
mmetsp:Transcript_1474/g.1425  ORF Transcript_1474/g.1425 Transcript_1474/m.1425 type:complete len:269 (+) Transcript_1474:1-807(+)